jgi:transcriptional regulator with XRE-family HTH domain
LERIKKIRKAHGLSLSQLAERTGLLPEAIARAERKGQDVRASTLAAIAKGLGVPVCELFEESGHGRRRAKQTKKP